ncbi:MAG: hypothetical protein ACLT2N_06820 [Roseburia faecis]
MDNIRNVIKIFFKHTSYIEVLKNATKYNDIATDSFVKLANIYMPGYSNNEVRNMLLYFNTEFEWHNNKMRNEVVRDTENTANVFDALLLFIDNVLVEENGIPLCRYENLLRWRALTIDLGEDMLVTSFLAYQDLLHEKSRENFFWSPVIGHNNKSLNRLMEQGVAENHFHLKGSAPLFHLSWISLMNDVWNPNFKKILDEYDRNRLHLEVAYHVNYQENTLYEAYLQAALIRLYLFACIVDDPFVVRGDWIRYGTIKKYLNNEDANREDEDKRVKLSEYQSKFYSLEEYKNFQYGLMEADVAALLEDATDLQNYLIKIGNLIENMRENHAPQMLDYTLCEKYLRENPNQGINEVIDGERWLLYQMFQKIYSRENKRDININWFYAYLLIKENVRSEMIQANGNVGFDNFLLYQNRKEYFIEGTPFEPVYLQMAVRDTILNQHIKKLEARITPKKTANALKKAIEKNDKCILQKEKKEKDKKQLQKKYFYVCHFIKQMDKALLETEGQAQKYLLDEYRHYEKRKEVEKQAKALLAFRQKAGKVGERIRGIDASSEEIVCRPEVFAQAFRFLKNESVQQMDYETGQMKQLPDICITYHVGEDFLDIIDGLRAIDEAMCFLNMRCGDRLGHALALGVDPQEWYDSKSGYILIPQMDYLDNLVWLYAKIRKYRIEGLEDTIRYIEKRYDEYFRIIYLNHMKDSDLEEVIETAKQEYSQKQILHAYGTNKCYFSINTYYDSWKLRGDNPENFREGFFKVKNVLRSKWERYDINKVFPENYRIRYNPEAAYLYYCYHYNIEIKKEGNKRKEIKVNPCIIKAVYAVQKKMQWVVAQKGIGIETNPSSNALIGTFKRYDKHPILNWYNNGLTPKPQEVFGAPQIQVSINTDDQGVFATYIENEYAYLALALEKLKDENGNPRYSRTLIYDWLDNIRKMGLAQSFEEIEK